MKTASWRVVHGRIDPADQSEDRSYGRAGSWTVPRETRRFHTGALAPLLAIALSVLTVGATAVCGLAVVSRWAICLSRVAEVDHLEPYKDIEHDAGRGG